MADRIKIIKGFQDVLPPRSLKWAKLEDAARSVFGRYGYSEIRLPVLEKTELFARGIGQGTDIVEKEMYSFPDRRGRSLSLRPEGTASVVRAYLDSGKGAGEPAKWYYTGPMFRYERPQKGRYRQFYQVGAEAIGFPGPGTDAEVMVMLDRFFSEAGIGGLSLELNSLGCRNCRPAFRSALIDFLGGVKDKLCADCKRRMDTNPLRVLDCKVEGCRAAVADAPVVLDFLDDDCKKHFDLVREDLDTMGIGYMINPRIVRGLDYYTRTVFEYLAERGLGSQNAVAAGGRYDGLVEEFGGPPTPAIGFALGVERAVLLMEDAPAQGPEYFVVTMGEKARKEGLKVLEKLRDLGNRAESLADEPERSVRSQMKAAAKAGARYALVLGDDEVKEGTVTRKDLETGEQEKISRESLLSDKE